MHTYTYTYTYVYTCIALMRFAQTAGAQLRRAAQRSAARRPAVTITSLSLYIYIYI